MLGLERTHLVKACKQPTNKSPDKPEHGTCRARAKEVAQETPGAETWQQTSRPWVWPAASWREELEDRWLTAYGPEGVWLTQCDYALRLSLKRIFVLLWIIIMSAQYWLTSSFIYFFYRVHLFAIFIVSISFFWFSIFPKITYLLIKNPVQVFAFCKETPSWEPMCHFAAFQKHQYLIIWNWKHSTLFRLTESENIFWFCAQTN